LRATVVVAVAELLPVFGSVVLLDTVAMFVMVVPSRVPGNTLTRIVKVASAPEGRLGVVQFIAPPIMRSAATGRGVQLQPAAPEFARIVVFLDTTSLNFTSDAFDGPLLVTFTV
jgi:hypothetical protein